MKDFKRPDLSNRLIHFTKGKTDEDAFNNLCSIIIEKMIQSTKSITMKDYVVCLTETPLNIIIEHGFVNYTDYTNYKKFGIMFMKRDIYKYFEGRPALYMEESCHHKLADDIKWRYTKFEPTFDYNQNPKKGVVDFSWEREWRVKGDLYLSECNDEYIVLVPNEDYKVKLEERINQIFTEKYEECNEHNPRYVYEYVYEPIENSYVEVEIENEDNCECNVFDPDENKLKILLLDKMESNYKD